jgi:RNA polymerase sigma-70 factor (ECF subfamily)
MSRPAAIVPRREDVPGELSREPAWGDVLLRTFTDLRDELVSTLWFMLGNEQDAQDVAQEVFLRCWRARDGLPEVQNLRAWIFRVGMNAAKDVHRSAWRRRVKPLLMAENLTKACPTAPTPEPEDREALQQVRDALVRLRPEEKDVFLLRQNGELTYAQIAQLHHRPVGTVKTQMRSALQKLRKVFTADEAPPNDGPAGDGSRSVEAVTEAGRRWLL